MSFILAYITVKAVGDIMLGSITPRTILPSYDGKDFMHLRKYLQGADVVFGNLEGVFIDPSKHKPSKCSETSRKLGRCYEFGMPYQLAGILKKLGFNVLSLDNNHVGDYGRSAYEFTMKLLDSLGIKYAPRRGVAEMELGNLKLAVVSFGFSGNSYHISNLDEAYRIVKHLDTLYDIVIVSFHGGAEGSRALHVRDTTETFYGENRGNVYRFARTVVDAGADLVIGHGPHVLRALEIYKGKLIAYSLGNFIVYGNISTRGYNGITAILEVSLDSSGRFLGGKLIPFRIVSGIPRYDEKAKAIELVRKLMHEDFPNNPLRLERDGSLYFEHEGESKGNSEKP